MYRHEEGTTFNLNVRNAIAVAVCTKLLSNLAGVTAPAIGNLVTEGSFIAAITQRGYEGAYYVLDAYWSGRQSKIVIRTYEDTAYTKPVKTYTEYVKW